MDRDLELALQLRLNPKIGSNKDLIHFSNEKIILDVEFSFLRTYTYKALLTFVDDSVVSIRNNSITALKKSLQHQIYSQRMTTDFMDQGILDKFLFMTESKTPTTRKLAIELIEKLLIIYKDPALSFFLKTLEDLVLDSNAQVAKSAVNALTQALSLETKVMKADTRRKIELRLLEVSLQSEQTLRQIEDLVARKLFESADSLRVVLQECLLKLSMPYSMCVLGEMKQGQTCMLDLMLRVGLDRVKSGES